VARGGCSLRREYSPGRLLPKTQWREPLRCFEAKEEIPAFKHTRPPAGWIPAARRPKSDEASAFGPRE
jgi:hypothetical protein